MRGDPQVVILVPAYNEAAHIGECLQSIVNQTFQSWSAIIVNNCSTDGTAGIADEFAREDERIRVVHCQTFVGQAENYNRALSVVPKEAKYIKFVEADNWITADCLARLTEVAELDPRIGIVNSFYLVGDSVRGNGLDYRHQVVPGVDAVRRLFLERVYLLGIPTSVLIRADAIRAVEPWFRPGLFYDDVDLVARILRSWKLGFVHQILSYQRIDNNGALSKFLDYDYVAAYKYFLLQEYGEGFFRDDELAEVLGRQEQRYFDLLSRALVVGRPPEYWDFHQRIWQVHHRQLTRRMIGAHLLRRICHLCRHPLSTYRWLTPVVPHFPRASWGSGSG